MGPDDEDIEDDAEIGGLDEDGIEDEDFGEGGLPPDEDDVDDDVTEEDDTLDADDALLDHEPGA